MAWDDLIRSIYWAYKILNKEFTEADLPSNWFEIRKLHDALWRQVYAKRGGNNG